MFNNIRILRRLKMWQRLALIAVLMGIPIPVVTYLLVNDKKSGIDYILFETYGAQYLSPVKNIGKDIARHRGLTNILLRGEPSVKNQILEVERAIGQQFEAAEETDQKFIGSVGKSYGELFQTSDRIRSLRQNWDALKSKVLSLRPSDGFDEHTKLIADSLDLIKQVADQSNLIFDTQLDTYYMMDTTVVQLPRLIENVGQLRDLGAGISVVKAISEDEIAKINFLLGQIRADLKGLERGMAVAHNNTSNLRASQKELVNAAVQQTGAFATLVDQRFLRTKVVDVIPQEFFAAGSQAVDRLARLDEVVLADLETSLNNRVEKLSGQKNGVLGLIILGALLTILAVVLIANGITRQADEITTLIANIDKGDLEARAKVLSEDELGQAAMAFNTMLDNTKGLIQSRDERDQIQNEITKLLNEVSDVAQGDLTGEVEVTSGLIGAIADAFNYMIWELRQLISRVQELSLQVTSTAGDAQSVADDLALGSRDQVTQINHTSTALDEMATSIQKVSEDAVLSANVAEQSLNNAQRGALAVQNTVKGMARIQDQVRETARRIKQLGERSHEIEEIVQLIDEIADRTGVLALNASIQASAAGEAGQGFAVVANEVEQLARRSADATKKIGNLVKAIQGGTNEAIAAMEETSAEVTEGSKLANQAGHMLGEIEKVSKHLAELIQAISVSAKQQARGSSILSKSMAEIALITQTTTSSVIQSAETVKGLASLADELRTSVVSFKLPQGAGNGNGFKGNR